MGDRKPEIIPAVLEESIEPIVEKIGRVKGKVERVSVDIIDGIFADNLTVALEDLRGVDFGDLKVEVQLMTEYPSEYLGECAELGVERVFGQVERMGRQKGFVEGARELGMRVGLGLDLFTPVESVNKDLLMGLDGVLLMSVKAGQSGQKFDKRVLPKIRRLREMGYEGDVQVDGGMNPETVCLCYEAGANQFSETSYLWNSDSIDEALRVKC